MTPQERCSKLWHNSRSVIDDSSNIALVLARGVKYDRNMCIVQATNCGITYNHHL
jgi:hypothetical protein